MTYRTSESGSPSHRFMEGLGTSTHFGDAILVIDVGDVETEHMLIVRVLFPGACGNLGEKGRRGGQRAFDEREQAVLW